MSTPQHFHFNKASGMWLTTAVILLLTFIFTLAYTQELTYARPQAVIPACDPIASDTTWTTGNIYVLQNCSLFINNGATLTLQPGVIVKFAGTTSGMRVNGGLIAQGTAVQPIIITSYADDSAGGDTNGDGASSGAPGDWYGIIIPSEGTADLDHRNLRYGRAEVFNSALDGWSDATLELKEGGQLSLTNSDVRAGGRIGVYLNGTTSGSSLTPIIHNTHIADHTSTDYRYAYALLQTTPNMQPSYDNVTFSGNTRNEVTLGDWRSELTQDVVLGGTNFGMSCGYSVCQLTIPSERTLTVLPNTLLDLRQSYGIAIASGGTLIAEGTPTQPITFTSKLAEGDDTGQYWMGIWAKPDSNLTLSYCDISYADDTNYGQGGLQIATNNATVSDCHIHHNKQTGLYIGQIGNAVSTTLTNVRVTDNGEHGVYLQAYNTSTDLTWDGGESSRNGYAGIQSYVLRGSLNPTLRNLSIVGNGTKGDTYGNRTDGISFSTGNGFRNLNPTLENLTISDNPGTAVRWDCDSSITAHNLTASGNGANELRVPGCTVSSGRAWDLGESGLPVRVTGRIALAANSLLNIRPGTSLQFDRNQYDSPTELYINANAALYALGTAESPIRFTGVTPTPGAWRGIVAAYANASLILNHCEVAYGGAGIYGASIRFMGGNEYHPGPVRIENCDIHHSATRGVRFEYVNTNPVFRYNQLHNNAEESVVNFHAPPLDARDNYWGDPTGPYHATQNPSGQGGSVGDNVLFYPWLEAPETGTTAGQMLISTGAPNLVSPGETIDYAIQYLNLMTSTVEGGVLVMQLPEAAEYMSSTQGGIYWPARHQVFWLVGDIAPQAQAFVTVRVRFQWGLPARYRDGSMTLFAADNYQPTSFDRAPYLAYEATAEVQNHTAVSQPAFTTLRQTYPDLETLYQEALAAGFVYGEAHQISYADGTNGTAALLRLPDRSATRVLILYEGQAFAQTVSSTSFSLHDPRGGMSMNSLTLEQTFWGDWQEADGRIMTACTPTKCKIHCVGKRVTYRVVKTAFTTAIGWILPGVGGGNLAEDAIDTVKDAVDCNEKCIIDPYSGCCDADGQVRWSPGGIFGIPACIKEECNATTGTYGTPGRIYCAFGQRCVSGNGADGGCRDCGDPLISLLDFIPTPEPDKPDYYPVTLRHTEATCVTAGGDCDDLGLRVAKDPNDITGLTGDLLPGQTVTYTIRYENEGAGRAYGVYVANTLSEVFDASSIQFVYRAGNYQPETRELSWYVGELGPKGDPDSEGVITYTVTLTNGLPSGTAVASQAVVYFSSVPEETPTNTWVNLIAPLVATPQNLTTNYMTPLPITLRGREVSDLPLTYEISELPRGGTLTGTPPNVVYTPFENFTGEDGFMFEVDNGTATSRPAQVWLLVSPEGDNTPPTVLWTTPAAGAENVSASPTPIDGGTAVDLYTPVILVGFSERLAEETLTAVNVSLRTGSNTAVSTQIQFDPATNQLVIFPQQALADGVYTVRLSTAVVDLAGNQLAAPYTFSFTVGDGSTDRHIYLPLITR